MEELYANTAVVECLKGVLKTLLDNHLLRRDAALEVFNTALKVCFFIEMRHSRYVLVNYEEQTVLDLIT